MTRAFRLSQPARRDLTSILRWSLQEFGEDAAHRYEALLLQAFRDIAENPHRTGALQRPELASNIRAYHLRHSRDRAKTPLGTVRSPRHFVIYRLQGEIIEVLRILHDVRELDRHVADE